MMNRLELKGWVVNDYDDGMALAEKPDGYGSSIVRDIENFAEIFLEVEDDFWETKAFIPNANIRIYVTENESTLDEAITALVDKLEGGVETYTELIGYSEWTITGMCVNYFKIGNHDLEQIIQQYKGKYLHFVLEA